MSKKSGKIAHKTARTFLFGALLLSQFSPVAVQPQAHLLHQRRLRVTKMLLKAPLLENRTRQKKQVKMKSKSINDYLRGLIYDKYSILTSQGETLGNLSQHSATSRPGEFVVIEKQKKSINNSTSNLSVTSSNDDRVFPGALFKADQTLLENIPTIISIPRAATTISIDLPGMKTTESHVTVDNPTNSSVRGAINDLVNTWNSNYSSSHTVPARIQYEATNAQSMNQLKAKFGADFEKIGAPLKINFEAVATGEKQIHVVNFKQIYYTASIDTPASPADFFGSGVTVDELQARGIDAKTPPVYVANVSYGRAMYVKFETSSKSTDVQAAIEAAIKGAEIKPGTEYHNILKNTSVTAVILGGNPNGAAKVVTGDINTLKDLIQQGSNLSTQSPAVPISYTTAFVKDNAVATLQNSTDYIETKVTSYKDGNLVLDHNGAYVARYYVNWEEYDCDSEGNETIRSKSWEGNGQYRTAHFSATIPLKGNVRNLRIKIQEKTGLVWEPWRTIYEKSELPLVQNRTISHWGTTLNPQISEQVENN